MRVSRVGAVAAALTLVLATGLGSEETPRPTDYEVKAAFLYNFAKFVKWPDETVGPTFVVALLGQDPFGDILDKTFAGKTVLERKVEVVRVRGPEEATHAQILFIASSERPRLAEILKALSGSSVLTVGESDGFADRGGMIAFKVRGEIVRFEINLGQAERARLKMSSQLVRLAQRVISSDRGL